MLQAELPISKSIANRLLVLQALHGDPLMEVSVATPQDVVLMRSLLSVLLERESICRQRQKIETETIDVDNCGTAARFLTAYASLREVGEIVITCSERMKQRPMRQLVEALCSLGADISYIEEEGFLPLKVKGKAIQSGTVCISQPHSTQFVSALMLMGIEIHTEEQSPYIELTRWCIANYESIKSKAVEGDWSAAAFWYEWVALHAPRQQLLLKGLSACSMQGDKAIAEIFSLLGVKTVFTDNGAVLSYTGEKKRSVSIDFKDIPDLYPAVVFTCHQLGVKLEAEGTDRLKWKESDREKAVNSMKEGKPFSFNDHRIAMSLIAADRQTDNTECVVKSYPLFVKQKEKVEQEALPSMSVVVARRGINDDGLGKKHALHKLITAASSEYVWLQDDDIVQPQATLLQMRRSKARSQLQAEGYQKAVD